MKECLNCKKLYEPFTDKSKYCCSNCRVYYFKKNKDKPKPKIDIDVLLNKINSLSEKIDNIVVGESVSVPKKVDYFSQEPKLEIIKDYDYWLELKVTSSSYDEWISYAEQIKLAENLSKAEKQILLKNF